MFKILRLSQVEELTGYKSTTIYKLQRSGRFPKSIELGGRATGWLQSEIEEWIGERVRASRDPGRPKVKRIIGRPGLLRRSA